MRKILTVLVCMIILVSALSMKPTISNAQGSSLDDGIALMKAGDEEAAFSAIKKAADDGVTEAFGKLAWMYYSGSGVKPDSVQAKLWAQKGADLNDPEGSLVAAWYYMDIQTESANEKALEILQNLAVSDDPVYRGYALNAMGWIYATSPEKNVQKAVECYQKAAELGNPNAMLNLADLYGWEYPEYCDYEAALKYYESCLECKPWDISEYFVAGCNYARGKANLDQKAMQNLYYVAFYLREPADGSAPNMEMAIPYHEVLTNYGDVRAASWLSAVYSDDEMGVAQNLAECVKWDKKILEIYEADPSEENLFYARYAAHNLGSSYYYQWGVERDFSKSLDYFSHAYELGNKESMVNITGNANSFLSGLNEKIGTPQDFSLALEWYNKAIELGNGEAAYELATFYEHGYEPDGASNLKSFPINLEKAKEYYNIAESLGYREEEMNK